MASDTSADGLPIEAQLPAIAAATAPPGATLLLQAPPGAGKTTRVPLQLLEHLGGSGKVLLLEPRRLAATAAARRLAQAIGEPVGQRVGYAVRLDVRRSSATRLEVLTAGLFLRRLQADPALEGVAAVILDEFHERRADSDLALTLLREARQQLNPALRLVVMSATLDLTPLAESMDGAVVLRSEGRAHPVHIDHQPPRLDEPLARQVVRALESRWLPERQPGDTVLVFLPGLREIQACQRAIEACGWARAMDCRPLHGQLSLEAQGRAIAPAGSAEGKVVLATAIAESSLTIAGVRLVIDSGLRRVSRYDPRRGLEGLVTQPASQASADQRAGRAGRLGPGRCLRLWSPAEQQRRPAFDTPELLQADPLPLALQLAEWGAGLGEDLPWITPPPAAALREARTLLQQLQALDGRGHITAHGRRMAELGLHPRLAHMLLSAQTNGQMDVAVDLAVLLSERDPLDWAAVGCDVGHRLDWLRQRGGVADRHGQRHQLERLATQLRRQLEAGARPAIAMAADKGVDLGALIALAYPERIALARSQGGGRFLMRNGRGARLPADDPLASSPALVIAAADDQGAEARVLLAARLDPSWLQDLAEREGSWSVQVHWDDTSGRVRSQRQRQLGALVLNQEPWADPPQELVEAALLEGIRERGLQALPWSHTSRQLQHRLALAHRHLGSPWPDRRDDRLLAELEHWLGPHLLGCRSLQDLQHLDLEQALWHALGWEQRRRLDQLLPPQLPIPSGRSAPLRYNGEGVVLAVKLQELFGWKQTPQLLDGALPVTLHLLSPGGRPLAITSDLAGFWHGAYGEVRREMRGRYPRHPWPEDPATATATALTNRQLRSGDRSTEGGSR
ncbi:MAG: ATP-dependent helicase HrpB [Cyanobacteriota bacterium]|nr:ATP-dependent helicase HrpB [Cyanobacteriota bacterium]